MKHLLVLAIIFISTISYADPFLVCDKQEDADVYRVRFEGGEWEESIAVDGAMRHDLKGREGKGEAQAGGYSIIENGKPSGDIVWSESTPFYLRLTAPQLPTRLYIKMSGSES